MSSDVPTIENLLKHVPDDVKDEARAILIDVGTWAAAEAAALIDGSIDDVKLPVPPGGGQLATRSLDEALAESRDLRDETRAALEAKKRRRKLAADLAESILRAALRILT